jgi:hypothetical protein
MVGLPLHRKLNAKQSSPENQRKLSSPVDDLTGTSKWNISTEADRMA